MIRHALLLLLATPAAAQDSDPAMQLIEGYVTCFMAHGDPEIVAPNLGLYGWTHGDAQGGIAVAGGEMLQNRQAFKELFERRAVDIVQPDASLCGGIREVLFIAELAELYGIQCIPHSWNGAIVNAASIHIAALIAEPTLMPGVGTPMVEFDVTENPFASGLLRAPLPLVDGCFEVPNSLGLGLDLNLDAIRALEVPRAS